MASHSWRLAAEFAIEDRDVAEVRDQTRSLIAGFASGAGKPMSPDDYAAAYVKLMTTESFKQANIYCEICGDTWTPAEAVAAGIDAGDECPGAPAS